MKKIVFLILMALMPLSLVAQNVSAPYRHLYNLIGEYKDTEGFEAVRLGSVGTALARGIVAAALRADGDREALVLIRAARRIRRIAIVDYEDCSEPVQQRCTERVSRLLEGCPLLMEVNSDGEEVRIYGKTDGKSEWLRDCVLYAPSSHALICLSGAVSVDSLTSLMHQ